MSDDTPETVWTEFWKPIVAPDGEINMEQLKAELYDFWTALQEVSSVYCHITGNKLSKITYKSEVVCQYADQHYEDLYTEEGAK